MNELDFLDEEEFRLPDEDSVRKQLLAQAFARAGAEPQIDTSALDAPRAPPPAEPDYAAALGAMNFPRTRTGFEGPDAEMDAARAEEAATQRSGLFHSGAGQIISALGGKDVGPVAIPQPTSAVALVREKRARELKAQELEIQRQKLEAEKAKAEEGKARHEKERGEDAARHLKDQEGVERRSAAHVAASNANAEATRALARAGLGQRVMEHEEKVASDDDKAVERLAKELGENPALISEKVQRIQTILGDPKYAQDLPGVGAFDARKPDALQSDEGLSLRADGTELVNILLMLQSGAGVSDNERKKKYRNYGVDESSSEEAFRQGMAKLPNDIASALKSRQAGFKPSTVETYRQRGGTTAQDIKSGAAGGGKVRVSNGKETLEIDPNDVESAGRDGYKVVSGGR